MDSDQTAPKGAVLSMSILFAIKAGEREEQRIKVTTEGIRGNNKITPGL